MTFLQKIMYIKMSSFDQFVPSCFTIGTIRLNKNKNFVCMCGGVEFYLYPTVGTVLIHSAKPELTEQDVIEYG